MNVSTTLPPTVTIRRGRLIALVAVVATLAATAAWGATSLAYRDATPAKSGAAAQVAAPASTGIPPSGFLTRITDHPTVVPSTAVGSTGIPPSGFLSGIAHNPSVVPSTACGTIMPARMPSRECQHILERVFLGTR